MNERVICQLNNINERERWRQFERLMEIPNKRETEILNGRVRDTRRK